MFHLKAIGINWPPAEVINSIESSIAIDIFGTSTIAIVQGFLKYWKYSKHFAKTSSLQDYAGAFSMLYYI